MNRYSEFYFHNFGNFIILTRPKYGSRIIRLYWEIHLKKLLGYNLYIKRLTEASFLNLYTLTDEAAQYYPFNSLFTNTDYRFETLEEEKCDFFKPDRHPDMKAMGLSNVDNYEEYSSHREKAISYFQQLDSINLELLRKIWNGEQINIPVYVIYRNPEKHFKSGLLQDVAYHPFVNISEKGPLGAKLVNNKEKCFELFDTELSESGYVGNHRGNYLSMLMPHIHHLDNLHFFNLDGDTTLDFQTIFEKESDDASFYKNEIYEIGAMDESQHRLESSHKQAYPVVNDYFSKREISTKFHQFYFADVIWYNKLIRDSRNIIQTTIR